MHVGLITIGRLAREAGVTPRAVRHYERLGLISAPVRTEARYRLFDSDSVARLKFIAQCRSLGFSLPAVADLLQLLEDPDRTCAEVAALTRGHLDLVDAKINDLAEMRRILVRELARCSRGRNPDCPILAFISPEARSNDRKVRGHGRHSASSIRQHPPLSSSSRTPLGKKNT